MFYPGYAIVIKTCPYCGDNYCTDRPDVKTFCDKWSCYLEAARSGAIREYEPRFTLPSNGPVPSAIDKNNARYKEIQEARSQASKRAAQKRIENNKRDRERLKQELADAQEVYKSYREQVRPSSRSIPSYIKKQVKDRDNGICQYCGDPATCIDHVYPYSNGGKHTASNLVQACFRCNSWLSAKAYNSFEDKKRAACTHFGVEPYKINPVGVFSSRKGYSEWHAKVYGCQK